MIAEIFDFFFIFTNLLEVFICFYRKRKIEMNPENYRLGKKGSCFVRQKSILMMHSRPKKVNIFTRPTLEDYEFNFNKNSIAISDNGSNGDMKKDKEKDDLRVIYEENENFNKKPKLQLISRKRSNGYFTNLKRKLLNEQKGKQKRKLEKELLKSSIEKIQEKIDVIKDVIISKTASTAHLEISPIKIFSSKSDDEGTVDDQWLKPINVESLLVIIAIFACTLGIIFLIDGRDMFRNVYTNQRNFHPRISFFDTEEKSKTKFKTATEFITKLLNF